MDRALIHSISRKDQCGKVDSALFPCYGGLRRAADEHGGCAKLLWKQWVEPLTSSTAICLSTYAFSIRRHAIRPFATSFVHTPSHHTPLPYVFHPRPSRHTPLRYSLSEGTEGADTNILSATPDLPTTGGELHAVKRTGR